MENKPQLSDGKIVFSDLTWEQKCNIKIPPNQLKLYHETVRAKYLDSREKDIVNTRLAWLPNENQALVFMSDAEGKVINNVEIKTENEKRSLFGIYPKTQPQRQWESANNKDKPKIDGYSSAHLYQGLEIVDVSFSDVDWKGLENEARTDAENSKKNYAADKENREDMSRIYLERADMFSKMMGPDKQNMFPILQAADRIKFSSYTVADRIHKEVAEETNEASNEKKLSQLKLAQQKAQSVLIGLGATEETTVKNPLSKPEEQLRGQQ